MANGYLGKSMSSNGNNVVVYTAPANADFVTATINLCNLGAVDSMVRIAVAPGNTPSPQDYIEYGATIPGNGGILERTCLPVSANERVIVYADSPNIAIRVSGLEKLI